MSASREKKLRQDQAASGYIDPKTAREQEQRKAEKRTNLLYGTIAVVFVLVVAASLVWKSNIIPRSAAAVTIDGEKYNAAQVNFYYQNAYRTFCNQNYMILSYLGLDTSSSLKAQTINATAASMLGVEEGSSWYDYIMGIATNQMTVVQRTLAQAKEEGFQFPDSVQARYDATLESTENAAASSGVSVKAYLQQSLGSLMTESLYKQEVLRMNQAQSYIDAHSDSLTYTDAQLEEAYDANPNSYDKVTWEYAVVSGAAESTQDGSGSTVDPTDEEKTAAMEAAKETAESILAAYRSGASLEEAASGYEKATYYASADTAYLNNVTGNWLFDAARQAGDADVLEVGSSYYVALFHSRFREETPVVNVRHILVMTQAGEKAQGDEGYEEEQAQLKEAARAKAEELLAQWKAGEATEDSFAQLAQENSEDTGSKYAGGLISNITAGSNLVETFRDWCLDGSRKSGDTGVVDSTYGSHVMYFVGQGAPTWKAAVETDLRSADSTAWLESMSADAVVEQKDFGMKFVG